MKNTFLKILVIPAIAFCSCSGNTQSKETPGKSGSAVNQNLFAAAAEKSYTRRFLFVSS